MRHQRRAVITGLGVVCPIGNDVAELAAALREGRNGVGLLTLEPTTAQATRFACQVKSFDIATYIDRHELRRMDRYAQFAIAATCMAVDDAGLSLSTYDPRRKGCILGSSFGGCATLASGWRTLREEGVRRLSPNFIPASLASAAVGNVCIRFGLQGVSYGVSAACASGACAIANGARHVQCGEADVVLCGGAEAPICEWTISGLNALKALSTRNDSYWSASRPFDKDRNGFVLGEGAAVVVIEELESAIRRGRSPLAEIVGVGYSNDAYHITAPHKCGEGYYAAMRSALSAADVAPEQLDYINAHGSSTYLNDRSEALAIQRLLEDRVSSVPVTSTKSMMGHLVGAAGAIEVVVCVIAMRDSLIPPNINYEAGDDDVRLWVSPLPINRSVKTCMTNSFGFGGHNVVLVLEHF
jgi:3-oxoacyl-[acyl-carrier-protein] synthase II